MDELMLVKSAQYAARPWNSIYAERDQYDMRMSTVYTDQKQIDKCLNCPRRECVGCLTKRYRHRKGA